MDATKIAALAAQAVAKGVDMTKAQQGGGDYTPPPEGPCNLRFISYIEIGKQARKVKGVEQIKPRCLLTFEVSGAKYPVSESGEPIRITIEETLSLNEKANFFKLFTRMNYDGKAQHITQLLGGAYRGRIVHDKWQGQDGKEKITAVLRNDAGYTITPPRVEVEKMDEDGNPTGEVEVRNVTVAPAISPLKAFLWDFCDMDQWNSLFIDGEYPARTNDKGEVTHPAKSKNVLQARIKQAKNFVGSPIHTLLASNGKSLDIPDAEDPADAAPTPTAAPTQPVDANDALAGVV